MSEDRKDRVIRIQQEALNGLIEKANASDSGTISAADAQAAVSHCQAEINALDDEEPKADLRTERDTTPTADLRTEKSTDTRKPSPK